MDINEIVVISGKGGTGKTSLVSSMIPFLESPVIADCDVDAPDLHIMFNPVNKSEEPFIGLQKAFKDDKLCVNCGKCATNCKFKAISRDIVFDHTKCEGCSLCAYLCPTEAITMKDAVIGSIFHSETKYGDLIHARLIPGEEASGKLVTAVRKKTKDLAKANKKKTLIIDGSPGVACNVISSITGASKVVIVVEPSMSGLHDLKRVYELSQKFRIPAIVVINKYDISPALAIRIENFCAENEIEIGLKIPFAREIVESIVAKKIPSLDQKQLFKEIEFNKFLEKIK